MKAIHFSTFSVFQRNWILFKHLKEIGGNRSFVLSHEKVVDQVVSNSSVTFDGGLGILQRAPSENRVTLPIIEISCFEKPAKKPLIILQFLLSLIHVTIREKIYKYIPMNERISLVTCLRHSGLLGHLGDTQRLTSKTATH